MAEKIDSETEVILQIENTPIKCNKQQLIQNSDYFKVMFEGNFIERNQKVVKLEGITLNAMNIILTLLWHRDTLLIEKEEDLISVLQTCCMLQFVEIKTICMDRLKYLLSPKNCIKIWLFAEQFDLTPLYLHARNLALMEFEAVKDSEYILELDLKQLHSYLANTSLQCKTELNVFQVCMKWWYENSEKNSELKTAERSSSLCTEYFLNLLCCLDFTAVSNSDIQEIMMYPDLSQNNEVLDILRCVINIREGTEITYSERTLNKAKKLSNAKPRSYKQVPCVTLCGVYDDLKCKNHKTCLDKDSVYYDKFKRKRYYKNIGVPFYPLTIAYYDKRIHNFRKFLSVDEQKSGTLVGYKLASYKEFVFLFGGEFMLGQSNWHKNFWVYDTIKEFWERKSLMPFVRRHFESCVCGHYVFIIGGTGKFRVIQDNMFWYNYKKDKWSQKIQLPCSGRQIKCCCWKNQLFILNFAEKCGYLFDQYKSSWHKMEIRDDEQIIVSWDYTVFSYKNSIYIKGENLIEMAIQDQQLVIVKCTPLQVEDFMEIQSIVCEGIVYTLYLHSLICCDAYTLEKYTIDSDTTEYIFKETVKGTVADIDNDQYVWGSETALFGFQSPELIGSDDVVNNLEVM